MTKKITPAEALDLLFVHDDADTETIRDYFIELLTTLWEQGEGFSGKRPFGNSGWERDLVVPLVAAGAIKGTIYDDNQGLQPGDAHYVDDPDEVREYCDDFDKKAYNTFVFEMIAAL